MKFLNFLKRKFDIYVWLLKNHLIFIFYDTLDIFDKKDFYDTYVIFKKLFFKLIDLIISKKIQKRIKWTWVLIRWLFVIICLNFHSTFFDFFYLLFYGFSFRIDNYIDKIIHWEIIVSLTAVFFLYLFFAKYILPIFDPRVIDYFYFFFIFVGIHYFCAYYYLYS